MCACVYISVCMFVYNSVCMSVHFCVYGLCEFVCMCVCLCVYACACMFVYTRLCVCVGSSSWFVQLPFQLGQSGNVVQVEIRGEENRYICSLLTHGEVYR